jgi:hypothetical protein
MVAVVKGRLSPSGYRLLLQGKVLPEGDRLVIGSNHGVGWEHEHAAIPAARECRLVVALEIDAVRSGPQCTLGAEFGVEPLL